MCVNDSNAIALSDNKEMFVALTIVITAKEFGRIPWLQWGEALSEKRASAE
ncbi:hypothetical protein SJDPG4_00105 [Porphyromonas gingivalis SJD4]|nr:hypothetical protein SJDPG4_00105 [Porphyromonas gingivalis SJD4]